MFHTIRQLEEKNVASEVDCMLWSNRMDLVAFSNVKGEVALHRLTWTKAWSLNPPKERTSVKGIAWRPDGKVLSIAYTQGNIVLIDVETKQTITSFNIQEEVSFISWIQEKPSVKIKEAFKLKEEEVNKFIDLSKVYLKDPSPISQIDSSSSVDEIKGLSNILQDQTEFNVLIIGTDTGKIHLKAFGCWTCLVFDASKSLNYKCSIKEVHFTEHLDKMFVTTIDRNSKVNIALFDTQIFHTHSKELSNVTMKYIKLYELSLYLEKILTNITETWENILLEIDNKLSKYASKVPEGGVTADFLDLLIFGICSEEMEEFLIHDLTKKGLEKFGQTMEISYSNIQTYLFRHVIKFAQNATYHFADLKGMASFKDRYGSLGLNEDIIQKSIQCNGSFVIKAGEMQQIINHSVTNYKAFFRWLYGSIMHIVDEPIPADFQKMTQQDLACITEFLKNFDRYGQNKNNTKFIMERVGQYLVDAPLTVRPDTSKNDWTRFLEENECLKSNVTVLQHNADQSLIQAFNQLKESIDTLFKSPLKLIGNRISHIHNFKGFDFEGNITKTCSINISSDTQLFAFLNPVKYIYLLQVHVDGSSRCLARGSAFYFNQEAQNYNVTDIQFYSPSFLSVLLKDSSNEGVIFQFPLSCALEQLTEVNVHESLQLDVIHSVNGFDFVPKIVKNINMPVCKFAVSGNRKISIVLAENKKKVKIFEMECEEEDDEDADMSSMQKDDVSMQGMSTTE